MRAFLSTILAGAVMVAAVGAYGDTKAVDSGKGAGEKLQQIGGQMADETTAQEVRSVLSKGVNDAVTEGHFEMLTGYLSKGDRDRMADAKTVKTEDLNKAIAQFRVDFKAKYNQDFQIKTEHFKEAMAYAGKDKNSATVSIPDLLLNPKVPVSGPVGDKSAAKELKPLGLVAGKGSADPKAGLGKDVVKGVIADKAVPGLTLNMVNEGGTVSAWKINIPDEITGEQLKGNLAKHIQMLDDQKAMWSADADAEYRAAAYGILQAFTDSSLASDR